MTQAPARIDFAAAVPQRDAELRVPGLHGAVTIRRDAFGVPHVRAENEHDAWFGQGYAAAQDRLWQMEYDRRRAVGRWSEAAGPIGLKADLLGRRLQIEPAARAEVAAMEPETRAMFEAYAAGINAFLSSGQPLPVEYALSGIAPELWEPWHSVALFRIRHVLMGVWQQKLVRAMLLAKIGPEAFARLEDRAPIGSPLILPPSATISQVFAQASVDLAEAERQLGFLSEVEAGSNSWAVHGSRTSTGMPVLCNDSHRALDVPNVYWQAHVAGPEFDVIGATFPGLPGFPHFGHNGSVAWSITHTSADYQDLYVEAFDTARPGFYHVPGGLAEAEHRTEQVSVRGAEPVEVELWRTRHGPVVHGDPRSGHALALRYTALDRPHRAFEPLRPMLRARTVAELHETQRDWVDPVNNLVSADTAGHIGYLTRGLLPVRASPAHRQFPAPGWTDDNEWIGEVPFEQMPQAIDPPEGVIITANQRVIESDEPFISHYFSTPERVTRIREVLSAKQTFTPEEITALQGDTVSWPARAWVRLMGRLGPFEGEAERARALLASWDGDLRPESGEALLYACFRLEVMRALFEPITGAEGWRWLTGEEPAAVGRLPRSWLAPVVWGLDNEYADTAPDGRPWRELLPPVLTAAWRDAAARGGADPAVWRWADVHATRAQHPLAASLPQLAQALNPPSVHVGGDGDTIQCSGYGSRLRADFPINNLSVYRQVVDLSRIEAASFVVPGGVAGLPGTQHYADQLEHWRTHRRIPAHYSERDVVAGARHTLTLRPA